MKHLSKVVNIIPVIAKADTMTLEEKTEFKQRVSISPAAWDPSLPWLGDGRNEPYPFCWDCSSVHRALTHSPVLDWRVSPGTALKMQLSMALRSHLLEGEEQWASL